MAKYDIGGVVASLTLQDEGFSSGLDKAASKASSAGDRIASSMAKAAKSADVMGGNTGRTANQIAEAESKAKAYAAVIEKAGVKTEGFAKSSKELGKGLLDFAGLGDVAEKAGKVVSGLAGLGPAALAAAPAVAAVAAALAVVGLAGYAAWRKIHEAEVEADKAAEDYIKTIGEVNAKFDQVGRTTKALKAIGFDAERLDKSWQSAADSIAEYAAGSRAVVADLAKYQAQQAAIAGVNSEIAITVEQTKALNAISQERNAEKRAVMQANLQASMAESAGIENVRKAEEALANARARAGVADELFGDRNSEFEAASSAMKVAAAKLEDAKLDARQGLKGIFKLDPEDLKQPKFLSEIISRAEKVRDASRAAAAENKEATAQQRAGFARTENEQQTIIDRLKQVQAMQEAVTAATKRQTDARKALNSAQNASAAARREALAAVELAERNLALAGQRLEQSRAQARIAALDLRNTTAAVEEQKKEVVKLGDAWEVVRGKMIAVNALASSTQQTSNRDLARRIQSEERRRDLALERGPSGQASAERIQGNIDKLQGRIKTGLVDESGRPANSRQQELDIERARSTMGVIAADIAAAEKLRKGQGNNPLSADFIDRQKQINRLIADATGRGAELNRRGFQSQQLEDLLDRAKLPKIDTGVLVKINDGIDKISDLLTPLTQMIGVFK